MRSTTRHLPLIAGLLLAGLLGACGGETLGEPKGGDAVQAVNLENGERRAFDAENLVPAGWAVCELDDCAAVVSRVPCVMFGPGACLLNATCRLRLRCDIDIPQWMRPADDAVATPPQGADPLPGSQGGVAEASYPVGCELICSPKERISCEEIQNPNQCAAQPQCDWETVCYDQPRPGQGSAEWADSGQPVPSDTRPACFPEDPECEGLLPPPSPCTGVCRPSVPQPCEEIDRYACERREDCSWRPAPLPMFDPEACPEADCLMPYGPFCRPRVEPRCPPVTLEQRVCREAQELVGVYDEQGCVIGQRCVPLACAPLAAPAPLVCPDGQAPVRRLDDNGCVVRVACEPVGCPELAPPRRPTCDDGSEPRAIMKDGCLVGYECLPGCGASPPEPRCAGSLQGIYRGECLIGWSCAEPVDPAECDELVTAYRETLAVAKRCGLLSASTTASDGDRAFAPPEWNGLCSMTMPSALGCSSCPTYVNPANQQAIARLNSLREAFSAGQCFRNRVCPMVMCVAAEGAACAPDAQGDGLCTDLTGGRPTI